MGIDVWKKTWKNEAILANVEGEMSKSMNGKFVPETEMLGMCDPHRDSPLGVRDGALRRYVRRAHG